MTTPNMEPKTVESCSLRYTVGGSDKVYHLNLDQVDAGGGYTVTAQYGRYGCALATDEKTKNGAETYDSAKAIYDKTKKSKLAKGYVETGHAAPANQTPAPAGADVKYPELLTEIDEATALRLLDNEDYLLQDKSDGHSRGVVKQGGKIFGINKLAKPVPLPKEIHDELARLEMDTFQIDAELVGNVLVCRDLVEMDGTRVEDLPYIERFNILMTKLQDCSGSDLVNVVVVQTWEGQGRQPAFATQFREHREGVVFKRKDAPYAPGRSGQHFKFKFVKTVSAIAGKPRAAGKDSVEVFLFDTAALYVPTPTAANLVRVGTVSLIGKAAVKEGDVLEVAYLYAHRSSKMMSQARLLRVRDDVPSLECTTAQLVYKREEA